MHGHSAVKCKTCSYLLSCRALPPFCQYQIILLGDRRTCDQIRQPEVKPVTLLSPVQHMNHTIKYNHICTCFTDGLKSILSSVKYLPYRIPAK